MYLRAAMYHTLCIFLFTGRWAYITIIDLLLLEICTMQFLWKYSAAPYKRGRGEGGVQVCVRGRGVRGSTLCYLRLQTLEKLVIYR